MPNWDTPQKPAVLAEKRIIEAILTGLFPINSILPSERELASQLGVTRPTLREVLQRLARDGWLEIQHGKSTRVRNYWQEGNLSVLGTIAEFHENLPDDFVSNLLYIRQVIAPAYTRLAIEHDSDSLIPTLNECLSLTDEAKSYAVADWNLHHKLTVLSGNPIFTLILNGFKNLYPTMGEIYFRSPKSRTYSKEFYRQLLNCAQQRDPQTAEALVYRVMKETISMWKTITEG